MKVLQVEFLEPVVSPYRGPGPASGMLSKFRDGGEEAKLTCRAFGPGVALESPGAEVATVVPWANVRFCQVDPASLVSRAK